MGLAISKVFDLFNFTQDTRILMLGVASHTAARA